MENKEVLVFCIDSLQKEGNSLNCVNDASDFVKLLLGFELRALHLLGRCSTTQVTPQPLFGFSYFSGKVLGFLLGLPWIMILLHNRLQAYTTMPGP
jgi:hypothetical protein